ncbi:hypothetical protein EV127DRAFT_424097 [Xylaria flabelliformis]|nr:hypothetical protein EV127DRAFT_424097 [Xylaria flabelliformis]
MAAHAIHLFNVHVEAEEEIAVVIPPSTVRGDERLAAIAGLLSTLGSPFSSQRSTVEVVYNLLCLGIPGIRAATPTFDTLIVKKVKPTKDEFLTWAGLLSGDEARVNADLPELPGPVNGDALAVTTEAPVYVALSSLLFCIGKRASESAKASVMDNRPAALILAEADQIILPGRSAGPAQATLESIYNSFANYTEVRKAIILYFVSVRDSARPLPIHMEIMMTNFNLMRGAGMTHVDPIIKLVRMHPWVMAVPELKPYFHKFLQDVAVFAEIKKSIRPYHRLLVPQTEYLFISSELRPLIAVARSFIEEKAFSGYVYNKEVYRDLIDKVKGYAPEYKPTARLNTLAQMLKVPTVPLPSHTQSPKPTREETV